MFGKVICHSSWGGGGGGVYRPQKEFVPVAMHVSVGSPHFSAACCHGESEYAYILASQN